MYCTIRLAKTKALISFKVLRLCFRICKMLFFSRRGLYIFRFTICCMYYICVNCIFVISCLSICFIYVYKQITFIVMTVLHTNAIPCNGP